MRMITNLLVASLLAIAVAGCDDTADCPAAVVQDGQCSSAGLICFDGSTQCTCTSGAWLCRGADMPLELRDLLPPPDVRPSTD
jgi:hypothetical protein